jgi:hypothetical protein
MPWRRGAVDIAFASGTEEPGSNPARVYLRFLEVIAFVYNRRVLQKSNKGSKKLIIRYIWVRRFGIKF